MNFQMFKLVLEKAEVIIDMSMVLEELWAACILELRAVFLCCWRIYMVCFALKLVGLGWCLVSGLWFFLWSCMNVGVGL